MGRPCRMKGIYLCSRSHRIPGIRCDYNDIESYPGINILKDALYVDLSDYDYIICTPPCNYYSKANYRRDVSDVANQTKHLLPILLNRLYMLDKPFIVENVNNKVLFDKAGLFDYDDLIVFSFGGHTFWTNIKFTIPNKCLAVKQDKQNVCRNKRDNNYNVDLIIKLFLSEIGAFYNYRV